jgi:myo-inositol-1(or 4)-monophosphatase
MNGPDLAVIKSIIKKVESKVYRDFVELENLQNSNSINRFVNLTIEKLKREFYDFFMEKRSNYSLIIKDGNVNKVEGAKRTVYVNCMVGIKNFMHSIPYFATVIAVKEKDKYVAAVVNNYATQEMFVAEGGGGTFLNTKRTRVSNKNDLANVMIGMKYDSTKEKFIKAFKELNMSCKLNNCYILDICHVAAAKLDGGIVFDGLSDELKIGELFIVEAGGFFEFLNEANTDCVYSNSLIHTGIKKALNF